MSARTDTTAPLGPSSTPERETPRQKMRVWVFHLAMTTARLLPERLGRRVFRAAGRIGARLSKSGVPNATANFAQVLGQPEDSAVVQATVREAVDRYAAYWYEACRIGEMSDEEFLPRMTQDGVEHIRAAVDAGTGAVMVMPHMGNWDAGGRWMSLSGFTMISVAEALKPRRLLQLFVDSRAALGVNVIPLEKGANVGARLAEHLAEGHVVALVADRDLSGRGVEVEMFGRVRRLPAGPAALSLSTGAPLHVCGVYTTETGWHSVIGAPLPVERTGNERGDVSALTREVGRSFERLIAASPADWHMFQPGWPKP